MIMQFNNGTAYLGDSLKVVKSLESDSVDCVITSPPYYQLRDYGFDGQWGLEPDYKDYLDKMIELMRELKRVLKPTGTMWINLGDSYNNSAKAGTKLFGNEEFNRNRPSRRLTKTPDKLKQPMPSKSLMLIPHRFAMRCIDELGLILRNDIIWAKPNGMPESVTDRFSKKHEFMFFFVKEPKYYFNLDSIRDGYKESSILRFNQDLDKQIGSNRAHGKAKTNGNMKASQHLIGKNPGNISDFWDIPTKPNRTEHYASYNIDLIKKPILSGTPDNGIILDPFAGTGTTAIAAMKYNRKFVMIEGNPKYYEIMIKNIDAYDADYKLNFEEAV